MVQIVEAYLRRLGVAASPPSRDALFALHRRHVERVSWQSIDVFQGRTEPIGVEASMRLISAGRSGYCFHLNGGFGGLLTALGYDVKWHRAGVQSRGAPPVIDGFHVSLTVTLDGAGWVVDVGLGDMPWEPLPLKVGRYPQGGLTYEVAPPSVSPTGWRLCHDPQAAFVGVDVDGAPVEWSAFLESHRHLSTSPQSPWVNLVVVRNRDETGSNELKGCYFTRRDQGGVETRLVDSRSEWFDILADVFYEPLTDYDGPARELLWKKVAQKHEEWLAKR